VALQTGKIVSIQVGKVQHHCMPENKRIDFRHPFWTSGIFKSPVSEPLMVTQAPLPGDAQADLENHGGPDNVVLAYDVAHYPEWRTRLGLPDLAYGSFGENFTVTGFSDHDVCIGDIWQIGGGVEWSLKLQVTQARQPCFKLARRLERPDIVKMVRESSWGGWYLRVLHEGPVEAGMTIELVERPHADWTVAKAVQTMYARKKEIGPAKQLAELPELSARWKQELLELD
jgi:MOSC domain-containing protein YiiM